MIHIHMLHIYIYTYYTHIIYSSQTWSFSNRNAIFQAWFVNGPGLGHPSGFLVEGSVIHRVTWIAETQRCSTQGVCRQGGVTRVSGVTLMASCFDPPMFAGIQVNVIYFHSDCREVKHEKGTGLVLEDVCHESSSSCSSPLLSPSSSSVLLSLSDHSFRLLCH
jgi:hypothetical protein